MGFRFRMGLLKEGSNSADDDHLSLALSLSLLLQSLSLSLPASPSLFHWLCAV